jgi:hypothetical protein
MQRRTKKENSNMGPGCAKIIIDNYGAAGSAGTAYATANEAACEALMQLLDGGVPWEKIKPITDLACKQAEQINKWRETMLYEIRELAERELAHGK